jgi:hypothetical protein
MGGFMKYAVEIGSGAVIYTPSFINIGSAIQKLIWGEHRQHGDRIKLLLFLQNKDVAVCLLTAYVTAQILI